MESEKRKRITIVCTGNVCRSPMAEHLLRHALQAHPELDERLLVRSAGISAMAGAPPSSNAVRALQKVGLNLEPHRSQPLSSDILEETDLVLGMSKGHLQAIRTRFPDYKEPLHLFREWVGDGYEEIPDPFGGSLEHYLETRDMIAEAIPSVIRFLNSSFQT